VTSPILRPHAVCRKNGVWITIGFGDLLRLTSALLVAGFLVGCNGVTNLDHGRVNHSSAPTLTITATPSSITLGSSTTLAWTSTDATTVTFDHGIGQVQPSGSLQQKPPATTTYNATATGPGGTAQASVTVVVGGQQGFQFTASPATITAGQSSTLTFSAPGATSVSIDHGIGTLGASGSVTVTPATVTPQADGVAPALNAVFKGRNDFDVVLVLDKSGSMADNPPGANAPPSKADILKSAVQGFVSQWEQLDAQCGGCTADAVEPGRVGAIRRPWPRRDRRQ